MAVDKMGGIVRSPYRLRSFAVRSATGDSARVTTRILVHLSGCRLDVLLLDLNGHRVAGVRKRVLRRKFPEIICAREYDGAFVIPVGPLTTQCLRNGSSVFVKPVRSRFIIEEIVFPPHRLLHPRAGLKRRFGKYLG